MTHRTPDTLPRISLTESISRRGVICAVCLAIVAITIAFLADTSLPVVVYRLIVDGGLCLLWLAAAVGWGAIVQRLARYRISIDLLDFVNSAALGIGLLSLIILGLGLAGWLDRITSWTLIGIGIGYLLATLGSRLFELHSAKSWFAESSGWNWFWIFAMPALGIALVASFVPPGVLWGDEPHGYDVVEYHLQVPREWYEAGRITPLTHNVFSYMPMNVELHYLLAMHLRGGPWAGMYLAQLMHLAMIVLGVMAIRALADDVIPAFASAIAPWLLLLAPIAYNEGGLLFFGAMSIGWAWRAIRDPEGSNWKCWALAGAFAGFACGTKLTAVPMLLIGVPLAALIARVRIRSLAVFAITGAVAFAPWLVRNQIWAGNPVFPEAMSVFGRAHFTEDQQERWRRAHSPTQAQRPIPSRFRAGIDQIAIDWRYGYLLLPLAIPGITLSHRREAWLIAVLLMIFLIVWLGFTHLQSRFFVLAIPAAAFAVAGGLREKPHLMFPAAATFAVNAILGIALLHHHYLSQDEVRKGRLAVGLKVLGVEDIRPQLEIDVPPDKVLVLVGGADAFVYTRPMCNLRYRTVFDVSSKPDEQITDAWAGPDAPEGAVWLINPHELQRMSGSYWNIAAPTADVSSHGQPYLVQK